jgi:hypothetical protein
MKRKDFLKPGLEEKKTKEMAKKEWHSYLKGSLGLCKKLLVSVFF